MLFAYLKQIETKRKILGNSLQFLISDLVIQQICIITLERRILCSGFVSSNGLEELVYGGGKVFEPSGQCSQGTTVINGTSNHHQSRKEK